MLMTTAITATDVVLSYGSTPVMDASSFAIPRGSLTAVIGPNGSGKSTLLNALAGLLTPTSGIIEVHGDAPIAYVLQATKVNEALPVTVREVVQMGRYSSLGPFERLGAVDREVVAAAMAELDVTDLADKHLHELSGGQRQRVFLAQGLAQDHEILLLDEPLTGLDITSAQAIDRVIHDATADGGTVVMTTHDLDSAGAADHVVLLAGRVVASGAPADVLDAGNLRVAYGTGLVSIGADDTIFIDDPAHVAVPGRHVHRERSIHVETSETDLHGG